MMLDDYLRTLSMGLLVLLLWPTDPSNLSALATDDNSHHESQWEADFLTMSMSHSPCKTSFSKSKDNDDEYEDVFEDFGTENDIGGVFTDCDEITDVDLGYIVQEPSETSPPVPPPVDFSIPVGPSPPPVDFSVPVGPSPPPVDFSVPVGPDNKAVISPTGSPSAPSDIPVAPTLEPSHAPVGLLITERPSVKPTVDPNDISVSMPTMVPTDFSGVSQVVDAPVQPDGSSSSTSTRAPVASVGENADVPSDSPTIELLLSSPPSTQPTIVESSMPTVATNEPTSVPTVSPSEIESSAPTILEDDPTAAPTIATGVPTTSPTSNPTASPTGMDSSHQSMATDAPSTFPTIKATTLEPTFSPTNTPTMAPTIAASLSPSMATGVPSTPPTIAATTLEPTFSPTNTATMAPTIAASLSPSMATDVPSTPPTIAATMLEPTSSPTKTSTISPTKTPTTPPTMVPSLSPSVATDLPTSSPTDEPTIDEPSDNQTEAPSEVVDESSLIWHQGGQLDKDPESKGDSPSPEPSVQVMSSGENRDAEVGRTTFEPSSDIMFVGERPETEVGRTTFEPSMSVMYVVENTENETGTASDGNTSPEPSIDVMYVGENLSPATDVGRAESIMPNSPTIEFLGEPTAPLEPSMDTMYIGESGRSPSISGNSPVSFLPPSVGAMYVSESGSAPTLAPDKFSSPGPSMDTMYVVENGTPTAPITIEDRVEAPSDFPVVSPDMIYVAESSTPVMGRGDTATPSIPVPTEASPSNPDNSTFAPTGSPDESASPSLEVLTATPTSVFDSRQPPIPEKFTNLPLTTMPTAPSNSVDQSPASPPSIVIDANVPTSPGGIDTGNSTTDDIAPSMAPNEFEGTSGDGNETTPPIGENEIEIDGEDVDSPESSPSQKPSSSGEAGVPVASPTVSNESPSVEETTTGETPPTETDNDSPVNVPIDKPSSSNGQTDATDGGAVPSFSPTSSSGVRQPSGTSNSSNLSNEQDILDSPTFEPEFRIETPHPAAPNNPVQRPSMAPVFTTQTQPPISIVINTSKPGTAASPLPTNRPSRKPNSAPPTQRPTRRPSPFPTASPSSAPFISPSKTPSAFPTARPTLSPTGSPSSSPSISSTTTPSTTPTITMSPTFSCRNISPAERNVQISSFFMSVSGMDYFDDIQHPLSLACDWIVNEDPLQLCPGDSNLVQRYALAVLYFYTSGDSWKRCRRDDSTSCSRNAFLSGYHECSWGGVTCDLNMNVLKLNLDENNMRGVIPNELKYLEYLEELDLDDNSLIGHFPGWVGSMKHLEKLDLDRNILSGPIPEELYQSTSLEFVDLDRNILSGTISTQIGQMSQLIFFQVDFNQMIGTIPTEIANLPNLQYLSVFGNGFNEYAGIPVEICGMNIQIYSNCEMCTDVGDCCTVCLPNPAPF